MCSLLLYAARMLPLLLAAASIGSLALPEPALAPKKCIVRIPPCGHVGAYMDVDSMTTENVQANEDENPGASLDAFWAEYRLLHRKPEIAAFLGAETLEDLNDVLPRDMKTARFATWAENTLTIAEGNRLRRALYAYHAQHNPRTYDALANHANHANHVNHPNNGPGRGGAACARGVNI